MKVVYEFLVLQSSGDSYFKCILPLEIKKSLILENFVDFRYIHKKKKTTQKQHLDQAAKDYLQRTKIGKGQEERKVVMEHTHTLQAFHQCGKTGPELEPPREMESRLNKEDLKR